MNRQQTQSNQYAQEERYGYGRADDFGGNENYAERGYSQQTSGLSQDRARHEGNERHHEWSREKVSHAGKGPKGYRRSDERIIEEVSEALTHSHDVDATEIDVEVRRGIVTLRGSVPDSQMKRAAEELIENLYGVQDVRNDLTLSAKENFYKPA